MDMLIIFGAKYLVVIPALTILIVLWTLPARERVRFTVLALVSLPIAYILAKIAGHVYFNPRPFVVGNFLPLVEHGPDNGFPSDHTLLAASLATLLTIIRPRIGAIMWVIAILVGISRVLAGVHHALDIIGAIVIAVIAVYATNALLRMRIPRSLHD